MGTVHSIKPGREDSPNHHGVWSGKSSAHENVSEKTAHGPFVFDIAHAIPGRLRMVFPHLKDEKETIFRIAGFLSQKPGVDRVLTNHFCASITVEYDHHRVEPTSLVKYMESLEAKDLASSPATEAPGNRPSGTLKTAPKNLPVGSSILWTMGGTVFVGMSFLGVIIPGLPTPPFVILAAYCYLRGSERHYRWLMNHPLFGKLVEETESGPRISRKAKKVTVYFFWFSIFLSCVFFVQSMAIRLLLILLGIVVSYYMLRK